MPDIENSRKTARKGAEWVPGKVPVKQPKNSRKNSRNSQNCFSGVSAVLPTVFQMFAWDPLGTFSRLFSAVFNVGHLAPL